MREPTGNLRVLFLTLEFRHGTFSGNGVLAQSQAHGLAKAGHAVLVVSGCPDNLDVTDDSQREISQTAGAVEVRTLRVPASKWGKLTARCPWRELADAAHARPSRPGNTGVTPIRIPPSESHVSSYTAA